MTSDRTNDDQRLLWVDGVGGYLVVLGDTLSIGRPQSGGAPQPGRLAILADLSSHHATLTRTGGQHLLTPHAEASVDGRPIDGPTLVADGSVVTLGPPDAAGSARLLLRKPHALSATALVTIECGHRTVPQTDGVLLMAESCVLGPKPHSHVRCPAWESEAILFRGADGLVCRAAGPLRIDGVSIEGPAPLSPGSRIEGQDFALCVEEVDGA